METKILTVKLNKKVIDNDIDHRTFKRMEASMQGLPDTSKDAVSSDTEEEHDSAIVTRYRDKRDARLRLRLRKWLTNETDTDTFTNLPESENQEYIYTFKVPAKFSNEIMAAVKDLMHEYIVRGSIYDWYLHSGHNPSDSESTLEELENDILVHLRGIPNGTRPLQPFGPPFPVTPLF